MTRRAGVAYLIALAAAAAFGLWTWLTLATTALTPLDATSFAPGVTRDSWAGQVLAAIAVVTTPTVAYVALGALTVWAVRRRLHNLAWASGISIPLLWGATTLAKQVVARPRPTTALPLITAEGWSYPSAHMATTTALVVLVLGAAVLTRRPRPVVIAWTAVAFVAWWLVALNRWLLRAHYASDIVGGALLGGTIAALALALAGVHVVRWPFGSPRTGRRAAVIVHAAKIADFRAFADQVQGALAQRGWEPPAWHLTSPSDPGTAGARSARASEVDLVLVAGGDGTVRAVCAELVDSGIPLGILPLGTGNLLARNLSIPLDLADAVDTALDGRPRPIDLIEVHADDAPTDHCLVMAGMGADAAAMADTRDDLKRVVGAGAYVVAGLQAVSRPPFAATIAVGRAAPVEREPAMVLIANVGRLQAGIDVIPDARPDDGLLDVLVASPKGVTDSALLTTRVLAGASDAPGAERAQGRSVVIETSEPVPYQIDGDAVGSCRRLQARVVPGAVLVVT